MPHVAPPTRPVLRKRYDQRRDAILMAAARTIANRGYEATSIADLSEATGLAAGGLYHYIGSKERLLLLICDDLLDPLLERAEEIVGEPGSPEEHLRRLLNVWLERIATHRDHMLVFTQERHTMERDPRWRHVRSQRKKFEGILEGILRRGESDGTMRFEDRGVAMLALLGMVNYTPQWLKPRGRLTPAEIADQYADLIVSAARPAPGR